MTDDERAEILQRAREYCEEQARKHGGPAPPLTEEERDEFDTQMHNFLRRGPPKDES